MFESVDRSFAGPLPDSSVDKAIATAVIALAHSLDMRVVAEGVETNAQTEMRRDLGCDEMQGHLLSRPLPVAALAEWLLLRTREEQQRKLSLARNSGDALPRMRLHNRGAATAASGQGLSLSMPGADRVPEPAMSASLESERWTMLWQYRSACCKA